MRTIVPSFLVLVLFSGVSSRYCAADPERSGKPAAPTPASGPGTSPASGEPGRSEEPAAPTLVGGPETSPAPGTTSPASGTTAGGSLTPQPSPAAKTPAAKRPRHMFMASFHPYVELEGDELRLAAGWGIELSCLRRKEGYHGYGEHLDAGNLQLLWSHHEAKLGLPGAEYFRVWLPVTTYSTVPTCFGNDLSVGFLFYWGPTLNYLVVDGPGSTGGPGFASGADLSFALGRGMRLATGANVHGWLGHDGELYWGFSSTVSLLARF